MDVQTKLMAQEKVVEGSQSFMQVSASESSFFNSAGLDLDYESGYVAKGAVAAVKDGDDAEENYEMKFADEITNDELVKLAYDGAVAKLGGKPVDCRIEDAKRTGEDFAKAKEDLGDLAKSEEDVMSYICFPVQAKKFLEDRKAKEENCVTYTITEA